MFRNYVILHFKTSKSWWWRWKLRLGHTPMVPKLCLTQAAFNSCLVNFTVQTFFEVKQTVLKFRDSANPSQWEYVALTLSATARGAAYGRVEGTKGWQVLIMIKNTLWVTLI